MADSGLQGRRVLIVEDETLIAMDLEDLLGRHGCTVLGPVPDVGRALALLERELPDGALLDLNLDGHPAIPIAEALSARGVPFVVVTGYSRRQAPEPVLQGAPRVAKPVVHDQLVRVLAETLDAR